MMKKVSILKDDETYSMSDSLELDSSVLTFSELVEILSLHSAVSFGLVSGGSVTLTNRKYSFDSTLPSFSLTDTSYSPLGVSSLLVKVILLCPSHSANYSMLTMSTSIVTSSLLSSLGSSKVKVLSVVLKSSYFSNES